jgi:hypothetical protein
MSHLQRLKDIADFIGEDATENQVEEFIYQAAQLLNKFEQELLAGFCMVVNFRLAKEVKERLL